MGSRSSRVRSDPSGIAAGFLPGARAEADGVDALALLMRDENEERQAAAAPSGRLKTPFVPDIAILLDDGRVQVELRPVREIHAVLGPVRRVLGGIEGDGQHGLFVATPPEIVNGGGGSVEFKLSSRTARAGCARPGCGPG